MQYVLKKIKQNEAIENMITIYVAVIIFPANHLPWRARCAATAPCVFSNRKYTKPALCLLINIHKYISPKTQVSRKKKKKGCTLNLLLHKNMFQFSEL
jgi:hypothetical protein